MDCPPILVQVSDDTFTHMADDLKYIGETTFRVWGKYNVPEEFANLVVYTGLNNGTLFPLFISKVQRVYRKNENEFICILKILTDIVRINPEFVDEELRYAPGCKTGMTEELDERIYGKIWIETENRHS